MKSKAVLTKEELNHIARALFDYDEVLRRYENYDDFTDFDGPEHLKLLKLRQTLLDYIRENF